MSQGAFGVALYYTNKGNVCNVKIQPETLGATVGGQVNSNIAGTVNQQASANVSGRRGNGVFCRKVNLVFTGAPPAGYSANGRLSVPWLTEAGWDIIEKGDTGTYLGAAVRCTGKTAESIG